MKATFVALALVLSGAFAQATSLVYRCDQKHGDWYAGIYWVDQKFVACFYQVTAARTDADAPSDLRCSRAVWSEDWDRKGEMLTIDFQRGWMFEGNHKGGVLSSSRTSFICDYVEDANVTN